MASAPAMRRVLVLHGYTQNASIFSKRLGALRKACAKDVEFVFVDAPIVLRPSDLAATFGSTSSSDSAADPGSLAALGAGEADATADDPALTPRAWWKSNAARTQSLGIDESVRVLRDVLKGSHFDGVFGFSQGAAMAAVLSALLERPHAYPDFLVDGQAPHSPFQFCVSVAGFRAPGALADTVFEPPYATPTLHVLGRTDIIVVEERAKTLLDVSGSARVVWHDGGHFVPSKGSWRAFLREYMRDPATAAPAPGDSADSAPPSAPTSGAATPTRGRAPGVHSALASATAPAPSVEAAPTAATATCTMTV